MMFDVTKEAQKAMKEFNKDGKPYLRVQILSGGCSGYQYKLSYEDDKKEHDTVIEYSEIKILQDFKSGIFLEYVTIDYKNDLNQSGFVYNNTQQTGSCGCKQSFSV